MDIGEDDGQAPAAGRRPAVGGAAAVGARAALRDRLRAGPRYRSAAAGDERADGRVPAEILEAAAGDRPGSSCSSGS